MNEKGKQNNLISRQGRREPRRFWSWILAKRGWQLVWLLKLVHHGWERWDGQLQEALGRTSLTQTAPPRRTAPGGRRLAQTHTWTCSAVQREPGKSARPGDMQQFSKAGRLSFCVSPHFLDGPQWLLPFCQDSGQDTGTQHWSPEGALLHCPHRIS